MVTHLLHLATGFATSRLPSDATKCGILSVALPYPLIEEGIKNPDFSGLVAESEGFEPP